ncbi:MAG: LuxR C-terminal-related transcriptional regulator [Actinomycetota bacterium]
MAAPPIPLIWAKLSPPILSDRSLARPELIDALARPGVALTAIVAPAGYGKTTAAVQVAQRLGAPTAWVALEPADDEPVRFWTYLAAALSGAGVVGAEGTYARLADAAADLTLATTSLRSAVEAHAQAVTLVLDDLHTVSDETAAPLGEWLRHPPSNLRIVCTSRGDLPLPVGRLRSAGRLSEARVADLAFGVDESADLLAATFGVDHLSPAQLAALGERTEGWPAGLYLAGLALRDGTDVDAQLARFTGDTRRLTEYLGTEAMDGLDEELRAFVLACSVVSVLHPDLCDQLTGHVGSLGLLRRLVAANVFTAALDEAATVFRFHPLFREHLGSALAAEHPDVLHDLHDRASRWYEGNGDSDEAISHAIAAGTADRAQRLVSECAIHYANAGHFATISSWVEGLRRIGGANTDTALLMAWAMLNLRMYADMDRWLGVAAELAGPRDQSLLASQEASIRSHRARHDGDVGAMVAAGRDALASAAPADDGLDDGWVITRQGGYGAAMTVGAAAAYWAGEPDRARTELQAAVAISRTNGLALEIVFGQSYLALIEAESGNADLALALGDQTLGLVRGDDERPYQPTLAHLARSIALADLGRPGDATDAIAAARRMLDYRREPLYEAAVELQQARLHHLAGDRDAARAAVRTARAITEGLPDARFDDRIRATENQIRFVARDQPDLPVGARELTDREQAVLVLLPHGLSRRELAGQLHVSENTIKTHLTSIRHKLGVSGRESIVDRAVDLGLLPEDAPS